LLEDPDPFVETYPWASLSRDFPAIAERVKDEYEAWKGKKGGLPSRIRLRLSLLREGEEVVVYGIAKKVDARVELHGSRVQDDPLSLFVTSIDAGAPVAERKGFAYWSRFASFAAILALTLACFFAYSLPLLNMRTGSLYATVDASAYGFQRYSASGDALNYWEFDAGFPREKVALQSEDVDVPVSTGDLLEVSRYSTETRDFYPGEAGYPVWDEGKACWTWSLSSDSIRVPAAPGLSEAARADRYPLRVKNLSGTRFDLLVFDARGNPLSPAGWGFAAGEGGDFELGLRLCIDEVPILVDAAHYLVLEKGNRRIRLPLGRSVKLAQGADGRTWSLLAKPEILGLRKGELLMKNSSGLRVDIAFGGKSWSFGRYEGMASDEGVAFASGDRISFDGTPTITATFLVEEGIRKAEVGELATWNSALGRWEIDAPKVLRKEP
jgi:hypothetical protein